MTLISGGSSLSRFFLCLLGCCTALLGTAVQARAQTVYGAIGDKWRQLGGAASPLGAPVADENNAARGGRFQAFQYGLIYWHPSYGAHAVYGAIAQKWNALGREKGFGYPLSDEQAADGGGRFNDFENGGSIYWHPTFGTHAVYGAIRAKWDEMGRVQGALGYPATDETSAVNGGRFNNFQYGIISWLPKFGAHAVYGRIGERWITLGREGGVCGYPTSDEFDFDDGRDTGEYGTGKRFRRSNFMNGYILFSKGRNQLYPYCGATSPSGPQPPPPTEACAVSVVVKSKACANADGSQSSILEPGATSATGCGANAANALARAKLSFQQFSCVTDGDTPSPNCCTISQEVVQGCLCR